MARDAIAEAHQHRLANDFAAARAICADVLQAEPGQAEALALMGICDIESGQVSSGAAWLDKALEADPGLAQAHLFRSIQLEAQDREGEALAAAQRASALAPDRFDVWGRLGDLAGRAGDFELARDALQTALALDEAHPARPHVALRLAGARMELGELDGVETALRQAEIGGLSDLPDLLKLRAALARQRGDWDGMRRGAEPWLRLEPDSHEARSALALALGQLGYYRRALDVFAPVVAADPGQATHWAALGRLALGARDMARAEAAFERALAGDEHCAEATFGQARLHMIFGRLEDSRAMCRRTLEIDPGNLEAYGLLCEVSGGRISDSELNRLESELQRSDLPADTRAIGLFALGDVHHARQDRARAFATWTEANAAKQLQHGDGTGPVYDRAAEARRIDWLVECFDETDDTLPVAGEGPTPIFIVGMPRSGTTLLEAAISAHPEVKPGGELSAMPVLFAEFEDWARHTGWTGGPIPDDRLDGWRRRYLNQYRDHGLQDARWVTDKQPANFHAVGLIRQMFPDAPVIHIQRKPVEVAFSIYRRNFSRLWPFAHDLSDIAHYYAGQARLGAHWQNRLTRRVTPVQYEALVRDFEAQLRYVLARIRLSWNRDCLDFHTLERPVLTFSAVQVRRAPSVDHLDSTTPYRAALAPFDTALAAYPVDAESGGWRGEDGPAPTSSPPAAAAKPGLWSQIGRALSGKPVR